MQRLWRFLGRFVVLLAVAGLQTAAAKERHGLSAFGELKYPPGFGHFDYVNPDAPKGGLLSMIGPAGITTFNSFNGYILKGDAAQGLELLFDTLMVAADDEPDSVYGLVAASASVAEDGRSATFQLRPEAKFADGTQVTSADVVFSFDILKKKGHPSYGLMLQDIVEARALDARRVMYRFEGEQVRDLPRIVATLPILSAKYYASHDFDKTTLEPPLGSGPYRIKSFEQGRQVTYERRADYWAAHLPVNRGRYNFDLVRYEYYRDRTAEFEGLTAHQYDLREEFTSRDWATRYNLPMIADGRMIRELLPDKNPSGAQGFFLNLRRDKFADARVRRAFDLAFDFEWTNKNLFYSSYIRTESFFENSDLKAGGEPSAGEIALLEPYRDQLPAEVFGPPYSPPRTDGTGKDRRNLRAAQKLLKEAGWSVAPESPDPNCGWWCRVKRSVGISRERAQPVLRNAAGEAFEVEFLLDSPTFERVIAPYLANLRTLGIKARLRIVDESQYQERVKKYDFDVAIQRYSLGVTPGVSMRNFWSSRSAGTPGSSNLAGIKSPVIDALIEKMIAASTRAELRTAAHALDRVLRAGHFWVPQWYYPFHRMAYWNKFSRPPIKPQYDRGIVDTWWVDKEKEARLQGQ